MRTSINCKLRLWSQPEPELLDNNNNNKHRPTVDQLLVHCRPYQTYHGILMVAFLEQGIQAELQPIQSWPSHRPVFSLDISLNVTWSCLLIATRRYKVNIHRTQSSQFQGLWTFRKPKSRIHSKRSDIFVDRLLAQININEFIIFKKGSKIHSPNTPHATLPLRANLNYIY